MSLAGEAAPARIDDDPYIEMHRNFYTDGHIKNADSPTGAILCIERSVIPMIWRLVAEEATATAII